jgi:hypothetical protein
MAEFLLLRVPIGMEKLSAAEVSLRAVEYGPDYIRKWENRCKVNDVIEVRSDGYWTGPGAKVFNENTFRMVALPGAKADAQLMARDVNARPYLRIETGTLSKETVATVADLEMKLNVSDTAVANLTTMAEHIKAEQDALGVNG